MATLYSTGLVFAVVAPDVELGLEHLQPYKDHTCGKTKQIFYERK